MDDEVDSFEEACTHRHRIHLRVIDGINALLTKEEKCLCLTKRFERGTTEQQVGHEVHASSSPQTRTGKACHIPSGQRPLCSSTPPSKVTVTNFLTIEGLLQGIPALKSLYS